MKRTNARKIIVTGVIALMCSMIGCSTSLPRVKIVRSGMDNTIEIDIGNDYKYWDYEKKINEDGSCCLIINFERKEN